MKEFGDRTKRYFVQGVIRQLVDRYILNLDSLFHHMYEVHQICIILEDNLSYGDLIDGVFTGYEKNAIIMENAKQRTSSESRFEFLTLT